MAQTSGTVQSSRAAARDHVAGHPTFSQAAATVLDDFFGTDDISFCSTSLPYNNAGAEVPPITLCYDSFLAASSDATISRIYGGIHTTYAVFRSSRRRDVSGAYEHRHRTVEVKSRIALPLRNSLIKLCILTAPRRPRRPD